MNYLSDLGGWLPLVIAAGLYCLFYGVRGAENALLRWDIGRSHKRHMARLKAENPLILGDDH